MVCLSFLLLSCGEEKKHFEPKDIRAPNELGVLFPVITHKVKTQTLTIIPNGRMVGDSTVLYFDQNGKLLEWHNAPNICGGAARFEYDSLGLLKTKLGEGYFMFSYSMDEKANKMYRCSYSLEGGRSGVDTPLHSITTYTFDSTGRVLTSLCNSTYSSENKFTRYIYNKDTLSSIIEMFDENKTEKSYTVAIFYSSLRNTTLYYTAGKLDSIVEHYVPKESTSAMFKTKYKAGLPDSVFFNGVAVASYRYTFYE